MKTLKRGYGALAKVAAHENLTVDEFCDLHDVGQNELYKNYWLIDDEWNDLAESKYEAYKPSTDDNYFVKLYHELSAEET